MDKGAVVTLNDDKNYIVVSSMIIEGVNFFYLVEQENPDKIKFCGQANDERLLPVDDLGLKLLILDKFIVKMQNEVTV